MSPAPVEGCRVLELGCGDGGNLIPIAYTLRDSEFLGVDLSARAIAAGMEMVQALGLDNVSLRRLDLLDAADLGRFDYILAHGVYSWVPPTVQERMLALCRESLNPHGVAYVSYSAYPGAHIRGMLAEMLQYHAKRFAEPEQQIEQARALLAFLAAARPSEDAYDLLLRQHAEEVASRHRYSIFHDELSPCEPVYFHQFAARAARHELQYLGEADFFEMQETSQPPHVAATLRELARDIIDKEQFLDFLKCRRFRQTLLCPAEVKLNRRLESGQMREFYVSVARRHGEEPVKAPTDHPLAKAAMEVLDDAWPAALSFGDLLERVRARAGGGEDGAVLLADFLLAFYACGLFQLHMYLPQFGATLSGRPRASAVARWQVRNEAHVTTLCHYFVHLEDDLSRRLVTALDGSRDRAAIAAELGLPGPDDDLDRSLEGLAKLALLEG
jgi:cyclopropane fatty-acyl-phospholipid synthase-like methyltransferase